LIGDISEAKTTVREVNMIKRLLNKLHREDEGFTLVELLVVIAILAILVAVVVPNFTGLIGRGKTEANKAELKTVQTIVDSYLADNRVSSLAAATTITPVNYSSGSFSAYFRSTPNCNYSVATTGAVVQDSCP